MITTISKNTIYVSLLILLTFLAFASYHQGTGSTLWLQYTTFLIFVVFAYLFDMIFCSDMTFVFDPDADNWRRKTEAAGSM